jgi:uncharacterized protein (DUF2141 family)
MVAEIIRSEKEITISGMLQPIVTIDYPPDGTTVYERNITVHGFAKAYNPECKLYYWEWIWEWEGGSVNNSSYFEPADAVEFWVHIYGLALGWNKVTVIFGDTCGMYGSDSVTIYYEDIDPPEVVIEYPADGSVFEEPNIVVEGYADDHWGSGIVKIMWTHTWEDGEESDSIYFEIPYNKVTFSIPVLLREGENTITVTAQDQAGNKGEDRVIIYTSSSKAVVDLDIWDGLDGAGGGWPVGEFAEETRGAFTVTNIQDTNGDGKRDRDQNPVEATPKGRNEVDLMKMEMVVKNVPADADVTLEITGPNAGEVKLWDTSTKKREITKRSWKAGELETPKVVWVEIRETDPTKLVMRGVTLTLRCLGLKDTVKATGIWANVTAVWHDRDDVLSFEVVRDLPLNMWEYINMLEGFGLRRYQEDDGSWWHGNSIFFQFTVYPPGIENEKRVYFDITRQCHEKFYVIYSKRGPLWWYVRKLEKEIPWPNQVELPNDDPHNDDESDVPSQNNHMYSIDAPRLREGVWPRNSRVRIMHFNSLEFIRVRLDAIKPSGNRVQGSRCSDYFPWHSAITLYRSLWSPDAPERLLDNEIHTIIGKIEIPTNCVGPGFILHRLDPEPPWKVIPKKDIQPDCH